VYTASLTSDRVCFATLFYRVYDAVSIPSYFRTSEKNGPYIFYGGRKTAKERYMAYTPANKEQLFKDAEGGNAEAQYFLELIRE
jgi:hypothetical protein